MACKSRKNSTVEAQISAVVNGAQIQQKVSHLQFSPKEFIAETINHLRAVLLSSKEGLTPKQILYDYIYFVGEPIPYLQLGHPDLVSFLNAHQDICERYIENGQLLYRPILDKSCEHIRRLVECQKSEIRKPRSRKRKSISINEEDAPPKRTKSDPRKSASSPPDSTESIPIESAPRYFGHIKSHQASTPSDKNKSVHFEDLLVATNSQKPQQRQRSRTRLPFFHKDDPSKPKFKGFRRRGKSTSALPSSTSVATASESRGGKANDRKCRASTSSDVVSSSKSKRFTPIGDPVMVTSTPRRSAIEIPVPDDIRKNLIAALQDIPNGILVHEIPALYKSKVKRDIPDFLTSSKALTEFFSCLTSDVRVIYQALGTVRIKLRKFDGSPSTTEALPIIPASGCSSKSFKSHVIETLLRILSGREARGIFLSRLRVEYKKIMGEVIPYKRLGFVSERLFLASMPEIFSLRTTTNDPGIEPEYIVSCAPSSHVGDPITPTSLLSDTASSRCS